MSSTNPFVMVHEALWELLEANSGFTALVPSGNRIKFTDDDVRDPEKVGKGGVMVRIEASGGDAWLGRTSNGSSIARHFEVQIISRDKRFSEVMDVEWEVWRALADWIRVMRTLTWGGATFVESCRPLAMRTTLDNADLNAGDRGWTTVWAGEIEMWFSPEALKP